MGGTPGASGFLLELPEVGTYGDVSTPEAPAITRLA